MEKTEMMDSFESSCRQHTCLYARMRTFFSCTVHASLMFGSRARRLDVFTQKSSHLCVMSLLGVLVSRLPLIASSPTCSLSRPSASSTSLTGTRSHPAPLLHGVECLPSGSTDSRRRLRAQVLRRCQRRAHADQPPRNKRNFPHDHDATIVATTEELDIPRQSGAWSSSQHTAGASRVRTVSKPGDLCRPRQKLLFPLLLGLNQEGTEIEIKTLCNRQETGKISTKSWSGRLNWPCEEKNWLSKKIY